MDVSKMKAAPGEKGGNQVDSHTATTDSSVSVPARRTSKMFPEITLYRGSPLPEELTDSAYAVAMDYWHAGITRGHETGLVEGYQAGMDAALSLVETLQIAELAKQIALDATGVDYAELSERRGEPERAARIRAYWEAVNFPNV